jgi:hypothetical protein
LGEDPRVPRDVYSFTLLQFSPIGKRSAVSLSPVSFSSLHYFPLICKLELFVQQLCRIDVASDLDPESGYSDVPGRQELVAERAVIPKQHGS